MIKGSSCCPNATVKTLQEEGPLTVTMEMVCHRQTKALAFLPPPGIQEMVGLETLSLRTSCHQQLHGNGIHTLLTQHSQTVHALLIKTEVMIAGVPDFLS